MRANTSVQLKERLQLQLQDFKGVDFSTSPLRVQSNRASDMANFINEYGVNKKRNGWNELFKIEELSGGKLVGQKINLIFQYINGTRKEMIVHAGDKFYRVNYNSSTKAYDTESLMNTSSYLLANIKPNLIKNQRSQVFFNKGRAYIIGCGDFLVYGTWDNGTTYELRRVADNIDTYIPTTTISIDDDSVADDTRASLDDINFLSKRRKNQLLGSDATNKTWTLDSGKIDNDTDVEITLETIEGDFFTKYTIKNNQSDKTKLYQTKKDGEAITATECGSLDYATGKITLSIITTPPIENRDNIFVTFEVTEEGYENRITNCNFGILFGVNGNADRLFVSGNADYPNIDFHSEMDDYTYFGDQNTAAMGSDSSSVNGYARLSDSTLVIYKESNGQEANIFYRRGEIREYYDVDGNIDSVKGVFPTSAGSAGESSISRFACTNFGGDNIMLSRNGVFGIVLANNAATVERYTRERSRSINEKLKLHTDLSEAVGIVYKNRYYLSVDDVCYVADSRFKYSSEEFLDGSYNYEWWYWDNIPARVWATIDNKLYFGSKNGQVCVFDDEYVDRTYQTSQSGDLAIDIPDNNITFNENINIGIAEDDRIMFTTDGIYSLLLDSVMVEDGKVKVTETEIISLFDGTIVYADNVGDSGLAVNTPYKLYDVDKGNCTFRLTDLDDNEITIASGGFRLHKHISNIELHVSNVTANTFQLKDFKISNVLTLSNYNNTVPSTPIAKFTHRANVVAKWYTPIFDLGTNAAAKTLLKMTISTELKVNGRMSFGYETKNANKIMSAKGINEFSFDNFSFENFTFDTAFANSYSVKVNVRNFNFIVFRFVSDNEFDCAINNFTAIYKINKSNKGVR